MVGSMYTMPIIVLNMGGEMAYILHQRLQAQSVQDEKAGKVLLDVARAMFNPAFIDELFKPQEMYTQSSTKQIFEKLAHSSIMRLNKSSMDKLYDLMTMGFKYQVVSCNSPQQYLQVTLNHLETIKDMVGCEEASEIIKNTIDKCIALYTSLTNGQWILTKQSIMRFLQGKKIKVSLFLQQSLQTSEGLLILNSVGELPFGTELPGTVKYFENNEVMKINYFDTPTNVGCVEATDVINPALRLGLNMYTKDANNIIPQLGLSSPSSPAQAKVTLTEMQELACKQIRNKDIMDPFHLGISPSKQGDITPNNNIRMTSSSAKSELVMLADLLGGVGGTNKSEGGSEAKHFKINLFPDSIANGFRVSSSSSSSKGFDGDDINYYNENGDKNDDDDDYDSNRGNGGNNMIIIDIDGTADAKGFDRYLSDLNLKDDESDSKANAKSDDDDDLLTLMDSIK